MRTQFIKKEDLVQFVKAIILENIKDINREQNETIKTCQNLIINQLNFEAIVKKER